MSVAFFCWGGRKRHPLFWDSSILSNNCPVWLPSTLSPSQPEDIFLVIEIADSSLQFDREVKLPVYAEAGIENVWICNLIDNCLEIYTQPSKMPNENFEYRQRKILLPEDTLTLPGFANNNLDLSTVFPTIS
ncbi:hypothetical protein CKA32_002968 [Geitlerinema sp. FC II]|nr:hypothetical protein CKA32_002968 [Geitlerinema sp. FC II]